MVTSDGEIIEDAKPVQPLENGQQHQESPMQRTSLFFVSKDEREKLQADIEKYGTLSLEEVQQRYGL